MAVDEARRHRVVVAARVGQVGVGGAVVADDARHQHVAHPLADERRHAHEQVLRVGVAHEGDAPEARERVLAARATLDGDGVEPPASGPKAAE